MKTQAKLKKDLDAVFSRYIRNKYAKDGMVKCYTCTTIKPVKEMQNGHWIPRNVTATRFLEENCRPQCVACNMFQKGKPDVFAVNLMREGVDIEELQKKRYVIFKVDRIWYENMISEYKEKLKLYACHKSQVTQDPQNRSFDNLRRLAGFRGTEIGVRYAEAYHLLRGQL